MKLAYIAGPYWADTIYEIVQNIRRAETIAVKYWKLGYAVICPHKNSALLDGVIDNKKWLDAGFEMLARSDICVMVPGWEKSEGATGEHDFAKDFNIQIIYEEFRVGNN